MFGNRARGDAGRLFAVVFAAAAAAAAAQAAAAAAAAAASAADAAAAAAAAAAAGTLRLPLHATDNQDNEQIEHHDERNNEHGPQIKGGTLGKTKEQQNDNNYERNIPKPNEIK